MTGPGRSSRAARAARAARGVTIVGSVLATALTAHTAINLRRLRRPERQPGQAVEKISVLLPVRDEAGRLAPCVRAVLAALDECSARGEPGHPAELVVLDDGSSDGTVDQLRQIVAADPRVRIIVGQPLPTGWLGKPHACSQLAEQADAASTVLIFLDADVVLAPHALAAAANLLRDSGLDLICPYPRQLAQSLGERLIQPLLQWSWLTTLPLRLAERSPRRSLSAGNGQFLVVDRGAYRRAGGHAAVKGEVLEDIALVRAVKTSGGSGGMVDGTQLATCRMYDGWRELRDGYSKSLWSAFGSREGALAAHGLLVLAYVWPPLAALLTGSPIGAAGYAAGVTGRVLVARRTQQRIWPDALAHPASIAALAWLTARSWRLKARGELTWKGRPLP